MTRFAPASPKIAVALSAAILLIFIFLRLRQLMQADWLLLDEDVDSMLRLSLVEALYRGGDWFHHVIDRMTPPEGTPTPWTRPLDVVLLAFAAPFVPSLGIHQALLVGPAFYGPACQLAIIALMTGLHRRLGGTLDGSLSVALLLLAHPFMFAYFGPQNADHHALLGLLYAVCLFLLADDAPLSRRRAVLCGIALGLGLWISTEFLAVLFVVHTWWALRWLTARDTARRTALAAAMTFLVLCLALIVERPVSEWGRIEYDTVALPLLAVAAFAAGGWGLLALLEPRCASPRRRLAAACLVALPAAILLLALFPRILTGPLGQADPFMQETFLPVILEMQPLWKSPLLFGSMLALALVVLAGYARRRSFMIGWPHGLLLAAMLFFLGASSLHQRMIYYVLPPLAVVMATALERRIANPRGRTFALLLLPLLPCVAVAIEMPKKIERSSETALSYNPDCYKSLGRALVRPQGDWAAALRPTDTIYAPVDMTPILLFQTPWRYLSGNYHRDVAGYRDSRDFAYAKDDAAALAIVRRRGIQLVTYCRAWERPDNYFSRLSTHPPANFRPVSLGDDKRVAAFLVERGNDAPAR